MGQTLIQRKYAHLAGYRGAAPGPVKFSDNVLYDGIAQQMDTTEGRWQTVCEKHKTIMSHRTLAEARRHLGTSEWCEECQTELAATREAIQRKQEHSA